jgi:hypothetical protein
LSLPLLRVWHSSTLTPAAATVVAGARSAYASEGAVRLTPALLGRASDPQRSPALTVSAAGCAAWTGQVVFGAAVDGDWVVGDVSGANPYAWPAGTTGLRAALRRKLNWLEGR